MPSQWGPRRGPAQPRPRKEGCQRGPCERAGRRPLARTDYRDSAPPTVSNVRHRTHNNIGQTRVLTFRSPCDAEENGLFKILQVLGMEHRGKRERAPPPFSRPSPLSLTVPFFSFVLSKQDSQLRDIQIKKEGAKLFKRKIHFKHLNFTQGRGKVRKNIFHPDFDPHSFLPSYSA